MVVDGFLDVLGGFVAEAGGVEEALAGAGGVTVGGAGFTGGAGGWVGLCGDVRVDGGGGGTTSVFATGHGCSRSRRTLVEGMSDEEMRLMLCSCWISFD